MPSAPFPHLDALQAIFDRSCDSPAPDSSAGLRRSLFPQPFVTAGTLMWPWAHAHRVLHEWAGWTRRVPDDVTSVARLVRLPHLHIVPSHLRGRSMVTIELAIPREPWVAAGRLLALRRLEPELDTIAILHPDAIHPLLTAVEVDPPAVAGHMALDALPADAIDAFVEIAGPASGSNLLSASLRHLGPAYGMAAAGVPADGEDVARLEVRLALLASRLAPFAAGRGAAAQPAQDAAQARASIRRR
jgi:hypothetical protein